MTSVFVPARHRADGAGTAARFEAYLAVVDLQPRLLTTELEGAPLELLSQCPTCTLVPFLRAQPLHAFPALAMLRRALAAVGSVSAALATGDAARIQGALEALGPGRALEILRGADVARTSLPALRVVGAAEEGPVTLGDGELGLVELGPGGPDAARARLHALARCGPRRVAFGFVEHAAAVEGWGPFLEAAGAEGLGPIAREARALGVAPWLAVAQPGCASLQWRAHRPLERLRARLDVALRTAEGRGSYMCPENVSGYAVVDDTRPILDAGRFPEHRLGLRFDRLLFLPSR